MSNHPDIGSIPSNRPERFSRWRAFPVDRLVAVCYDGGAERSFALTMLVWADSGTGHVQVLREYAAYTMDMAAAVLGAGLIGALLLEDLLVHTDR